MVLIVWLTEYFGATSTTSCSSLSSSSLPAHAWPDVVPVRFGESYRNYADRCLLKARPKRFSVSSRLKPVQFAVNCTPARDLRARFGATVLPTALSNSIRIAHVRSAVGSGVARLPWLESCPAASSTAPSATARPACSRQLPSDPSWDPRGAALFAPMLPTAVRPTPIQPPCQRRVDGHLRRRTSSEGCRRSVASMEVRPEATAPDRHAPATRAFNSAKWLSG